MRYITAHENSSDITDAAAVTQASEASSQTRQSLPANTARVRHHHQSIGNCATRFSQKHSQNSGLYAANASLKEASSKPPNGRGWRAETSMTDGVVTMRT